MQSVIPNRPRGAAIAIVSALGLASIVWAAWPVFVALVRTWDRQPDYSHGYLIPVLALFIAWTRRDTLGTIGIRPTIWGFIPLFASFALLYAGEILYLDHLQHGALLLWIASFCLVVGGWRFAWWALPMVLYLAFMFPMPFRFEQAFSEPLQQIATTASCWLLQLVGLPAYATGKVIHVREHSIEVVHACSGLRMIIGFLALCTAYALLSRRTLKAKAMIIASAIPIAIICNVARITVTGILYCYASAEIVRKFTHDLAGWAMMPLALLLLLALLWYIDRLFVASQSVASTLVLKRRPIAS